jgi:hypothetical protein
VDSQQQLAFFISDLLHADDQLARFGKCSLGTRGEFLKLRVADKDFSEIGNTADSASAD